MHDPELPLLELFTRLRDAGLPLGIDEYHLVLRALQAGFGIPDREALARLCRTLWVKSDEDKLLFDYHFDQVMAIDALLFRDLTASPTADSALTGVQTDQPIKKRFAIPLKVGYAALGGIAVVAVGYAGWFFGLRKECPYFTSIAVAQAKIDKEYRYNITVCQPKNGSAAKISAVEVPPWLKLKDNGDSTATLSGTPTTADNKVIYVWDIKGNQLATLKNLPQSSDIKFSPDGQYFINKIPEEKTVFILDLKGNQLAKLKYEPYIYNVGFSTDSKRLAITSDNGKIRQYDLKGNLLKEFKASEPTFNDNGDYFVELLAKKTVVLRDFDGIQIAKWQVKGKVEQVFIASKKQYIATYSPSPEKTLRLWDFKGNKLAEFQSKKGFYGLSFSDDDRYLIYRDYSDKVDAIYLWDIESKKLTKQESQNYSDRYNNVFSPDWRYFTNISSNSTIRLWNLKGKQVAQLPNQKNLSERSPNFSHNGQYFATILGNTDKQSSSQDEIIRLWDSKGSFLTEFKSQSNVSKIIFSPDEKHLATLLENGIIRLWDNKGNRLYDLKPQNQVSKNTYFKYKYYRDLYFIYFRDAYFRNAYFRDAYFNSNGQRFASVSQFGAISFWELKGNQLSVLKSQDLESFLGFSSDGQYITTTLDDGIVHLWDFMGRQLKTMKHQGEVSNFSFTRDNQHLNTVSKERVTRLWNSKGHQLRELRPQKLYSETAYFSKNGKYFADILVNGTARLWTSKGNLLAQIKSPSPVYDIVFSPNSQRFVTYLQDGTVSLWDIKGNQLAQFKSSKFIYKIIFSPDSQKIATFSEDGTVSLWDVKGNQLAQLKSSKFISEIIFSPDSQKIATFSEDGTVSLWDVKGNQLAQLKSSKFISEITFSPDSQKLAINLNNGRFSLWDLKGNQLKQFQRAIFSPKQQYFVNISKNETVELWDLVGKQLATLKHLVKVNDINFSADGKVLATTLANNTVQLWNFKGKKLGILKFQNNFNKIYFSPDGKSIATTSNSADKNNIILWNIEGKKLAEFTLVDKVDNIIFSKDGKSLAIVSYNNNYYENNVSNVQFWDIKGNKLSEIKSHSRGDVKFSPDGQFFITISANKAVELWDFKGKKLGTLQNQGSLDVVGWSPDGQNIITTSTINTAHLWDIQGHQLAKLQFPDKIGDRQFSFRNNDDYQFSADGEHLITTNDSTLSSDEAGDESKKTLRLWSLRGQPAIDLSYEGQLNDKDFSPNGQYFATASGDGAVRLWDMQGNLLIFWHERPVKSVRFSLDGQSLVSRTADGIGHLWDLKGNQVQLKQQGLINRIEFSPDKQHFMTISQDDTVNLWNFLEQKSIELKHRGIVSSVVFSPDGQSLATASQDNTTRLWNLQGKTLAEFKHPDWVNGIKFSQDGKYLFTTASDRILRMWNLKGKQLAELQHPSQVSANEIIFAPNGQHLISTSSDHNHKVTLEVTDEAGHKNTQSFTISTITDLGGRANTGNLLNLMVAGLFGGVLFLGGLSGGYVLFKWLIERRAQEESTQSDNSSDTTPPLPSDYANDIEEDDLQVAQAVRHARGSTDIARSPFAIGNEYFPVTRRQMKQSWRYLRQFVRQGLPTELDIEATVQEVSRHGFLLKPVLIPRRVNRTELLLLIDQDGSMIPFHSLSRRLAETALYGGRLAKANIYYFHNSPNQHLYYDPNHQDAETVSNVIASIRSEYTSVMIFSDAGAARGGMNPERIEMTATFLEQLKQQVSYIVWLNPVPRSRWLHTSADEIAKLVPMFEFNRRSLHEAINVLRGKPAHSSS
ncbi:hypothetical protein IQ274_06455 [Nostoc sp. LEGE 12447]|uniref:eIF2A-related protein n=1 Tax=Nostoc sp. LEGE 12447 TaxID=1828640 RepID=UPI001883FDEC|nr:hypothetical protein [Nostoc sp. LEGE 12447]MBE8997868.1 hypothetical protein [Nostoc sp. LEGE 12447]